MEVAPPIKYRRRKVSAVRDYPKGCGPSAAPKKPAVMLSNGSSPPEEKPPEVAASSDKLVPTPRATPESAEPVGNNTKPVDDAPEAPAAAVEDGKGAAAIGTKSVADGLEAPAVAAAAIATKPVGDAPVVPAVAEDVKEVGVNDTKPVGDAPEVPPVGDAPAPPVGDSPEAPATEVDDGKGVVANDPNPNPVDDAREAPAEAAVENVKGAATNDTSPFGDAREAPAAAAAEEEEDGKGSALKLDAPQEKLEVAAPHQPEPSGTSVVVEVAEELCYSRIYPPPKRRKLSAIREFPANCGPKAPRSSNLKVASAKADILDGEKTSSASQKKAEVEVENDEPKLNSNPPAIQQPKVDKSASETEVEKDDPVKDAGDTLKRKRSDEEKKPMAKKPPASEDSIKVTSSGKPQGDSLKRKRTDEEKQPIMTKPPASEGSVKVKSTEKPHGEAKRNDTKLIRAGLHEMSNEAREVKRNVAKQMQKISQEVSGESQEAKRSGTKKIRDKAQEDTKQISERALEVRNGARDVKMSDTKQVREKTQEVSGEAQVKSSPKSSLSERTAEDRNEKKDLVEATPEKKPEGRDTKQLSKSLPVKQAHDNRPDLDVRSESGSKSIVKVGGSSAGKLVKKESAKHQSDSKILKRKPSADEGSKALIIANVQTGEDLDLEACRKKVIVQALMAAPNCPWRQGRKSGGAGSRSVTPKSRIKKERKPLSALKGSSSSQRTSEVFDESVEDSVLHSEGDEKALVLYEPPPELSITLPPLAPPKSDYNGGDEELSDRYRVKRALRLFQFITRKLLQGDETKTMPLGRMRVDLKAAGILKEKNEYVNSGKPIIGHVPGVEVGDEFRFRVELSIIGIHRPFQGGIDYTKVNGIHLATSIVASGGYPDDVGSSDVLIYSGSGGNPTGGDKQAEDQKLERGNLALKNSIDAKTPVRVVHGFKEAKGSEHDPKGKPTSTFTYDGLYVVEKYWSEPGPRGFSVYKFQLRRMAGQPELSLKEVKKSKKSKVREGLCVKDISDGKERIPICAVNTIDDDKPMPFRYTTENIYPSWYVHTSPRGCDCTDGCSDSEKCACAGKNGGEIPFNYNGAIVQAKPLVYECGPSCKCPRSCHNRVSQHGIKIPLEIFKTESRGWGVRSLYSIPSGSFICEYIGELLKDSEAEQRSNDEYLFDIGHNYEDKNLWEGLPSLIPELQPSSSCETVDDVGFTIDAADYGNIGRFINHSCSPNIYAQNVLYDHDDKRMPHIMFFAADNIPPLQELTYHYNYTIDQVRDSEGNIKTKNCYCGAPECSGRLY